MSAAPRPVIAVVVCSTRPGRLGDKVARWFHGLALQDTALDARLVDIAAFNLPVYNEARHSRLGDYEHAHTRAWARCIGAADGFAFVAPEYNHGPSPALVNALTYLGPEWAFKPAGFVSYGGRSGGIRAAQLTKPILSALRMFPTKNGVMIPTAKSFVEEDRFAASEQLDKEGRGLLAELAQLAVDLAPLRGPKAG
jgi:NAD(P)H-dependent FMN reductase